MTDKIPDLRLLFDNLKWEYKVLGQPPYRRQDGVTEIVIGTFRERNFIPAVRFFDGLKPSKTKVVTVYYYLDRDSDPIMVITERPRPRESKKKGQARREVKGYGDR